jgi:hypothetical protein
MSLFKQFKLTSIRSEGTNDQRRHSTPDAAMTGLKTIAEVYLSYSIKST